MKIFLKTYGTRLTHTGVLSQTDSWSSGQADVVSYVGISMEILSFFLKVILIFQQETHNPVTVVKRAKKIYLKNDQNIDVFFSGKL